MTKRLMLALGVVCSVEASASGFYFGDNGTKSLLQGGAFAAQADDLTALQHNPAGLSQLEGIHFLLDAQLIGHDVSFHRQDPGFDPNNPSPLTNVVKNKGGLFLLPFLAGSYNLALGERTLGLALGVYGPPSVGRYEYENPNYAKDPATSKFLENPRKYAPNRYALINNDILILYPTLSASLDVLPKKLMVGFSAQLVVSHFYFRQSLYSGGSVGLPTPQRMIDESPEYDSIARVSLAGDLGVTGIFGVLYKPTDTLSFGASFRPSVPIKASGAMDITLGEVAKAANTQVTSTTTTKCSFDGVVKDCPIADLSLRLPAEFRLGARWKPMPKLGINADFVLQGWDSVQKLVLAPRGMTLTVGTGAPANVEPLNIPKKWLMTYSGRLGGSYDLLPWLTAHAGVWYETSAAPDNYYSIDFAHPDRLFITAGASARVGFLEVIGGVAFTPAVTRNVLQSEVRQGETTAGVDGGVVGAGVYTSGGFIATLGVRGHFGSVKPAPAPVEVRRDEVTPAPAPATP